MAARLAALVLVAAVAGGCNAAGDPSGTKTFSDKHVPFTFRIPADFTKAPIDQGDTRGDVVAAAGLTKFDVIAVRRARGGIIVTSGGEMPHTVQGHEVVSELHPVLDGYVLECQYTPERAKKVRAACREAVASVTRR